METRQLPAPEQETNEQSHPVVTLVLIGIACTWLLVFVIGMGKAFGGWAAWWSIVGIGCLVGISIGISHLHERHKANQLHQEELKNQAHHRSMTHLAIINDHSAEHISATSSFRAISKYMGPTTVNIKDNNLGAGELAAVLPTSPTFSNIIEQVKPGHLFLGQGTQGAIWGDVTDLLSTLNVGRPGTGKSTLLRNVTGQLLDIGGKPIIFDPHGSVLDDLGTSFECAESPKEIMDSARWLEHTLNRRLIARRAGERNFQPLLLMADEMPAISAQSPDALPTVRRIVSEGRKVAMFCIISGVGVPADVLGGSIVRDSMASRYIFLTTSRQASMAGIDSEIAKPLLQQLEEAGPGKAILGRVGHKPELVSIPYTTVEDIRSLVPGEFPVSSEPVPTVDSLNNGNQRGNYSEPANETSGIVRKMLLEEKGPSEIASTAFPGMRKEDALKEVRKTIAQIVKERRES